MTDHVFGSNIDTGTYGASQDLSTLFDGAAHLQSAWNPPHDVDALSAQATGTPGDFNQDWLLSPIRVTSQSNPIANLSPNATGGVAGGGSMYPATADALAASPCPARAPSPQIDSAIFMQVLESIASETQKEVSSPAFASPSTRAATRSARRVKTSSPYPVTSPSSSSNDSSPTLPPRIATRRNAAVSTPARATSSNPWQCPYCPWIQKTRRSPDLKRHIETHTRSNNANDAKWVCCGVPFGEALARGVPPKVMLGDACMYAGQVMVGGCRQVFSRRDALKRHLRTRTGVCYGDALAPYLRGNQVGAR
ncbi:hypothetical protein PYCCODRAFT_742485 [Trametes coccinea BRFM310]|uniref:Uncharacterized protein n=1 Tax=Trametes coccinea (strain BRFM310) TaxID=1353009 RepID=A0A1Y2IFF0_TRAC3|nr:hypothetical protein PYCCODRAFT_742485 [Trametes coccinea BRFM310]